jgi:hypothetical protein
MSLLSRLSKRKRGIEVWPGEVHVHYDGTERAKDELRAACQMAGLDEARLFVQIELPSNLVWLLAVGTGLTEFLDPTPADCAQQLRREAEAEIEVAAPSLALPARILPPRETAAAV